MMLSEQQFEKIKSENELLHIQLQDINTIILQREEELAVLHKKIKEAAEIQSKLEITYEELAYMQNYIGKQQQNAEGAANREASMEDALMENIKIEKDYYEIKEQYASATAALQDINQQLNNALAVYKQLADAQSRIAELESTLAIANEEKEWLKHELNKYKK